MKHKNFQWGTHPNKPISLEEDPRPLLRVVKCCGNCNYYHYISSTMRRGTCSYPLSNSEYLRQIHGLKRGETQFIFLPAHTNCLCDGWKKAHHNNNTAGASEKDWCNAEFFDI